MTIDTLRRNGEKAGFAIPRQIWQATVSSDVNVLLLIALISVLLRTIINGQYGFHRDELLTYTNALHLDWGYVPYPPVTAFLARIELELFGTSLRGFCFFGAVAQSLMMLFAGLSARELGGKRWAQVVTAIASGLGGVTLVHGSFYSYTSFDQLSWMLVTLVLVQRGFDRAHRTSQSHMAIAASLRLARVLAEHPPARCCAWRNRLLPAESILEDSKLRHDTTVAGGALVSVPER